MRIERRYASDLRRGVDALRRILREPMVDRAGESMFIAAVESWKRETKVPAPPIGEGGDEEQDAVAV